MKLFFYLNKKKDVLISIICFIFFNYVLLTQIYDLSTSWIAKQINNNDVDYNVLRDHFPPYSLCFLTTQTVFLFSFIGSFYYIFKNKKWYQTLFFCSLSFVIFNIFAMTRYRWETFKVDWYATFKTLTSHLLIPIVTWLLALWIRKDVLLTWKTMFIFSFYLTFFYLLLLIIYYSVTYEDENGQLQHIKLYNFFDFNKKIMIFPTTNIGLRVLFTTGVLIATPVASFVIFFVYKFVFFVKVERFAWVFNKMYQKL